MRYKDLGQQQRFALWEAGGRLLMGWVHVDNDDLDAGLETMRSAVEQWRSTSAEYMTPYFHVLISQGLIKAGRARVGVTLTEDAAARITKSGERWFEPEVYRFMGESILASGADSDQAERCFNRALTSARSQCARLWQVRAGTGLAELWRGQGKADQAAEILLATCDQFGPEDTCVDLINARQLLQTISTRSA